MADYFKGITDRYPLMTAGGVQMFRTLHRADVLRLIVGSTLPAAQQFERGVLQGGRQTIPPF